MCLFNKSYFWSGNLYWARLFSPGGYRHTITITTSFIFLILAFTDTDIEEALMISNEANEALKTLLLLFQIQSLTSRECFFSITFLVLIENNSETQDIYI